MTRLVQTGLSLSPIQKDRIKALAERRGVTHADIARQLIDIALPLAESGQGLNIARLVIILEFASLALDKLMQRQVPEEADRLLDLAIEHARKYHAA